MQGEREAKGGMRLESTCSFLPIALLPITLLLIAIGCGDSPKPEPANSIPLYSSLVMLGDSHSDTGNGGRFTDGRLWIEFLADELGRPDDAAPGRSGPGANFSVGGAQILRHDLPDLSSQLRDLEARRAAIDGDALYLLWFGFNDLLQPQTGEAEVDHAVTDLVAAIRSLGHAGARHFLVLDVWDMGTIPAIRIGRPPEERARASRMTARFNERLARALAEMPGDVRLLGVAELIAEIERNREAHGFRQDAVSCGRAADCTRHLYWDQWHLAEGMHRLIAERALELLSESPAS